MKRHELTLEDRQFVYYYQISSLSILDLNTFKSKRRKRFEQALKSHNIDESDALF